MGKCNCFIPEECGHFESSELCPSCAEKDERIARQDEEIDGFRRASEIDKERVRVLEEANLAMSKQMGNITSHTEMEQWSASEGRIKELEEEARQVCGALGEFCGKGQGTAVEKIRFMREDHAERIKGYEAEKFRRMYYQGIVYAVCNWIDAIEGKTPGHGVVCGTYETPSEGVEEALSRIRSRHMETYAAVGMAENEEAGQRERAEKAESRCRELEEEEKRLRGDLRAATGELMDLAHSKPRPIHFYEEDGTERVLEWEDGDESAGILAGYVLTDESDSKWTAIQSRLALLENLAEAYICESECLCRDDESRCLRDRLRAALAAKEGKG